MSQRLSLDQAISKVGSIRDCKELREFKLKWDGKIPRVGATKFDEYIMEVDELSRVIEQV